MRFPPTRASSPALCCALIIVAGTGGCSFLRGEEGNASAEVMGVRHANVCGTQGSSSRLTLLPDAAAAHAWRGGNGFAFEEPDLLRPARYIVVEMGERPTGGFDFAVSRKASLSGGTLQLTAVYLSQIPGHMVNQMVTSPCGLLEVPPDVGAYRRVELFDAAGTLLADSQPAEAPRQVPANLPESREKSGINGQ